MQDKNILLKHPAHLWIGNHEVIKKNLITDLQKIFCKNKEYTHCNCSNCDQIKNKQFYNIHWINPEASYTLEDIDTVLEQTRFKLDQNQHKFFIFCKSEELSAACSNRLLKTIEEPYPGYHFIFLTNYKENILPTIISRCLIKEFNEEILSDEYQEFLDIFIYEKFNNPLSFIKLIDKLEINPQNSKYLIDQLFNYFYLKIKSLHLANSQDSQEKQKYLNLLTILKEEFSQLPGSGSTKIFWKNLFIKFHLTIKIN